MIQDQILQTNITRIVWQTSKENYYVDLGSKRVKSIYLFPEQSEVTGISKAAIEPTEVVVQSGAHYVQ